MKRKSSRRKSREIVCRIVSHNWFDTLFPIIIYLLTRVVLVSSIFRHSIFEYRQWWSCSIANAEYNYDYVVYERACIKFTELALRLTIVHEALILFRMQSQYMTSVLQSVVDSIIFIFFFFSSRRRHTRSDRDWSSDVCSSD